ncbi:MAG: haloacid dehalogenase type II [Rhodobacteraceae bacterium]|nr:haloacid dehalogenase type II [Paracoccaceae bacterium]
MPIKTVVFDAYGTLFDVASAARTAASEPHRDKLRACWQKLADDWRLKQLQYTWLRAIVDVHGDFWDVTQDGLDWALENNGLHGDIELRARLLQLYWELDAYPEVPAMLKALKDTRLNTAILSNGSPKMLAGAVQSAGLGDLLDDILSVEDVQVFKPSRFVYSLVTKRFDCIPEEVLFVSSNGWDAAAAAGFGFYTTWVNRVFEPMERLPWKPKDVLSDLTNIPQIAVTN